MRTIEPKFRMNPLDSANVKCGDSNQRARHNGSLPFMVSFLTYSDLGAIRSALSTIGHFVTERWRRAACVSTS